MFLYKCFEDVSMAVHAPISSMYTNIITIINIVIGADSTAGGKLYGFTILK